MYNYRTFPNRFQSVGALVPPLCTTPTITPVGIVPCFINGQDVERAKDALRNSFLATNSVILSCGAFNQGEIQAWNTFKGQFDDFDHQPTGFFRASDDYHTAETFEQGLADWQNSVKQRCGTPVPGPVAQPGPRTPSGGPLIPGTGIPSGAPGSGIADTLSTIAIAGAVIVGGFVLLNFLPKGKGK